MRLQTYVTTCLLLLLTVASACAESASDEASGSLRDDDERAADAAPALSVQNGVPLIFWPWDWWRPRGGDAGAGNACNVARCEATAQRAARDLTRWKMSVTTCCRSRTQCGIQAGKPDPTRPAAQAMMQSLVDLGCSEPNGLAVTAAAFEGMAKAIEDGPELVVKDGRVDTPGGGRIVLDPSCPDLNGDSGFVAFTYPGCCDASGLCGNSNHTLPGLAQAGEQHRCLTWEELLPQQSEFIPLPDATTPCRGSARSTP